MKARVKATGEIVDVEPEPYIANDRLDIGIRFTDNDDNIYRGNQLDFENLTEGLTDVKEKSLPKDEPDYWTKLHHQASGMILAGMLANSEWEGTYERLSECAIEAATVLVNKLKEEQK